MTTPHDPPVDRPAALAAGAPGIPRKFWYWVIGAALVLALGGALLERVLSVSGLNPTPTATSNTTSPANAGSVPVGTGTGTLRSSLASLMGLATLGRSPAPAMGSLVDQRGQPFSLRSLRRQAVVVTFFDGRCNDICPVEGAEIRAAESDLGSASAHVAFVTVNTDPKATALSGLATATAATGLASEPNWHMVTGPLAALDQVWQSYGVTINYDPATGAVAHNDVMYFLDPRGDLRYRATPFANEARTGVFTLAPASVARWGQGIAQYAAHAYALGSGPG